MMPEIIECHECFLEAVYQCQGCKEYFCEYCREEHTKCLADFDLI